MSSPHCPVPSLPWAALLLRHRVKGQFGSIWGLVNNWAGDKSHSKEKQRQRLKVVSLSTTLIRSLLPEQRPWSIADTARTRAVKAEKTTIMFPSE